MTKVSRYTSAALKKIIKELTSDALILLAILSAAFGIKGFLLSSHFIDGGVTGVSMLLSSVLGLPLALLIPVINLPFIALGYRHIGLKFAVKSTLAIAGFALCLAFVSFPDVTPDKLLTAVFGGFFIGGGIGLAIRGGAVLDGTEIAALLISKRSHLLRVGDVILILNIFIFLAAAFFLGVEPALYSILTYAAASRTIDFIIHGIEEYTAIIVVSTKGEELKEAIAAQLNLGVTVLSSEGGMGRSGTSDVQTMLYSVVTRLEIGKVKNLVNEMDPAAFITTHGLSAVEGGLIKRPLIH
jgi:uncharacterized membrane-anchored protein YitT (DUF2179 family)